MSLFENEKRAKIVARIGRLTPDAPALWGRMNVNQMICHCTDGLRGCLGELGDFRDESNFLTRSALKWLVLYVLPIPKEVPTAKRVDQVDGTGTRPTDFETDRRTLIEFVEKVADRPADFEWSPHFKFGALSRAEWGALCHKHIDHHLRQFGV
ncbi:MAG: DUF1569 domain-containing protein [Acidobacteria bacterium]|nr:DUF1569 domain-containing protein [Acidobacteriota bacterium]